VVGGELVAGAMLAPTVTVTVVVQLVTIAAQSNELAIDERVRRIAYAGRGELAQITGAALVNAHVPARSSFSRTRRPAAHAQMRSAAATVHPVSRHFIHRTSTSPVWKSGPSASPFSSRS